MEKVGLARGNRSYDAVRKALELVSDDVHIPSNLPVLIKTNMVMPMVKLAATPVQAVQAVMDYLGGEFAVQTAHQYETSP